MTEVRYPLHLFQAFGVELEYMIVDARTLMVRPITDEVMHAVAGEYVSEFEMGSIAWSNELALHVIELKTNGPAASVAPLAEEFQDHVGRVNQVLADRGAMLMPTAMHPTMDPLAELKLWPHEYNAVYEAFNRVFDCRGHGWANLQSVHLNLPFADDAEFGRLHAAIRLVLPILPALAASSPMIEGRLTGKLDNRLDVYRHNARRVPMVSGQVVPEAVFTRADYEREIFAPLYADIAPHDPEGTLQNEWLNARGAIARFDRGAIEIRVLDIQECPAADLAIVATIAKVLELLCGETWTPLAEQQSQTTAALAAHLWRAVDDAGDARIDDAGYLRQFGLQQDAASMREVWTHLVDAALEADSPHRAALGVILREGTLAKRIVRALAGAPQDRWRVVYGALCDCLRRGAMFLPDPLA